MTITVKSGATISSSGGSDVVYSFQRQVGDTLYFQALADTDLRLRRTCEVKVKPAKVSASSPNGYTQARVRFYYKEPILLANGKITVNGHIDELHFDVEATTAVKQRLLDATACGSFTAGIKTAYIDTATLS